jgi:hypothetical protein
MGLHKVRALYRYVPSKYVSTRRNEELDFGRVWLPCNLTAATGVSGDNEVILGTSKPASFAVKTLAQDPCTGFIVANEFSSPRTLGLLGASHKPIIASPCQCFYWLLIQSSCFKFPGGVEFISSRPLSLPPLSPGGDSSFLFSPHSILFLFADLICLPRRSTSLFLL